MMQDIVGRLRGIENWYEADVSTCKEAADEIERLTERCEAYKGQVKAGSDEIERLRASLATATRALEEIANAGEPRGTEPDDADWRVYALEAQRLAKLALTPSPDSAGVEVTPGMLAAGAQALADDVWHPPQRFESLPPHDANKFRRQALLVLKAALQAS